MVLHIQQIVRPAFFCQLTTLLPRLRKKHNVVRPMQRPALSLTLNEDFLSNVKPIEFHFFLWRFCSSCYVTMPNYCYVDYFLFGSVGSRTKFRAAKIPHWTKSQIKPTSKIGKVRINSVPTHCWLMSTNKCKQFANKTACRSFAFVVET